MFTYLSDTSGMHTISHCCQTMPMDATFRRHIHTNYEILMVVSGDVHYNIDGEHFALRPYDMLLIPASTYHFLIPISNSSYESYVLNFSQEFVQKEHLQSLFDKPRVLNILTDLFLHRMFGMFDLYYQTYTRKDFEMAAELLLNEILLYVCYKIKREDLAAMDAKSNPLIARITAFISANLQSDLNSERIAKEMNFSKSYVQNLFSSEMEIGLQQYVNQKKIHAAHYDIQNGLAPSDAAAKYGYHNYSSFYRQYKKFFGHSPRIGRP